MMLHSKPTAYEDCLAMTYSINRQATKKALAIVESSSSYKSKADRLCCVRQCLTLAITAFRNNKEAFKYKA